MPTSHAVTPARVGLVLLGGLLGSSVRHLAAGEASGVPWEVLAVNLIGAAIAGWLIASIGNHAHRARILVPVAVIGVAGALTTFGGMAVDVVLLADTGDWVGAAGYAAASILLGPVAAGCGILAGSRR